MVSLNVRAKKILKSLIKYLKMIALEIIFAVTSVMYDFELEEMIEKVVHN